MRRILTALVLLPTVVSLVLWGPAWLIAAVVVVIAELAVWEFFRLAQAKGIVPVQIPGYVFAAGVVLAPLCAFPSVSLIGALAGFLLVLMSWAMLSGRDLAAYFGSVSATFLGVLYAAIPLSLLLGVCLHLRGRLAVLFTLVLVWTGDTMAFFVGSAWGRHKLAPQISPGKTWEGSAASLGFSIVVALAFVRFALRDIGYTEAIVFAAGINVAAQIGDLAESALKRSAGVKYSSQLVPGHGGVLDRIDALLFAAPVLWYYWLWRGL
ncbi:MAG: phosphatidate cytidylyltransferase [Acidobacteria bacterium]|nr:phosphatidate cytidylyltransferase [Acidobacteriota bacterium]